MQEIEAFKVLEAEVAERLQAFNVNHLANEAAHKEELMRVQNAFLEKEMVLEEKHAKNIEEFNVLSENCVRSAEEVSELKKHISSLEQRDFDRDKLMHDLEKQNHIHISTSNNTIHELRLQVDALQKEKAHAEKELAPLKQRSKFLDDAQKSNTKLESDNKAMHERINELERLLSALDGHSEKKLVEKHGRELKKLQDECTSQVTQLNRNLHELRDQHWSLEKQLREKQEEHDIVVQQFKSDLAKFSDLEAQLKVVNAKCLAAVSARDSLQISLQQHEERSTKLEQDLASCHKNLTRLDSEKSNLIQQYEADKSRLKLELQHEVQRAESLNAEKKCLKDEIELQTLAKADLEHRLAHQCQLYDAELARETAARAACIDEAQSQLLELLTASKCDKEALQELNKELETYQCRQEELMITLLQKTEELALVEKSRSDTPANPTELAELRSENTELLTRLAMQRVQLSDSQEDVKRMSEMLVKSTSGSDSITIDVLKRILLLTMNRLRGLQVKSRDEANAYVEIEATHSQQQATLDASGELAILTRERPHDTEHTSVIPRMAILDIESLRIALHISKETHNSLLVSDISEYPEGVKVDALCREGLDSLENDLSNLAAKHRQQLAALRRLVDNAQLAAESAISDARSARNRASQLQEFHMRSNAEQLSAKDSRAPQTPSSLPMDDNNLEILSASSPTTDIFIGVSSVQPPSPPQINLNTSANAARDIADELYHTQQRCVRLQDAVSSLEESLKRQIAAQPKFFLKKEGMEEAAVEEKSSSAEMREQDHVHIIIQLRRRLAAMEEVAQIYKLSLFSDKIEYSSETKPLTRALAWLEQELKVLRLTYEDEHSHLEKEIADNHEQILQMQSAYSELRKLYSKLTSRTLEHQLITPYVERGAITSSTVTERVVFLEAELRRAEGYAITLQSKLEDMRISLSRKRRTHETAVENSLRRALGTVLRDVENAPNSNMTAISIFAGGNGTWGNLNTLESPIPSSSPGSSAITNQLDAKSFPPGGEATGKWLAVPHFDWEHSAKFENEFESNTDSKERSLRVSRMLHRLIQSDPELRVAESQYLSTRDKSGSSIRMTQSVTNSTGQMYQESKGTVKIISGRSAASHNQTHPIIKLPFSQSPVALRKSSSSPSQDKGKSSGSIRPWSGDRWNLREELPADVHETSPAVRPKQWIHADNDQKMSPLHRVPFGVRHR